MSNHSKFRDVIKKNHRNKYYKSKAFDKTCRCHGTCQWCMSNRLFSTKKRILSSDTTEYKNEST